MARSQNRRTDSQTPASPDLAAQREYSRKLVERGFDFSLVVADAFIRGIRDIGYKHTGTAIYELIDNALQGGASAVQVVLGFESAPEKKPDRIAVIDNGHGMDPTMIRAAVVWGGTHRENDRSGFGRYGYGLPSASVSQGRRFTVYSCPPGGEWHRLTIDVDEIGKGKYADEKGRVVVPEATPADLPAWLASVISDQFGGLPHGTVVEIEELDRLTWKTSATLERHLLEHLGVTYRNFLREVDIRVSGKKVESTDPLFTTPGFRFHALDADRAEALPPLEIKVKDGQGVIQRVAVRFSYMPPTFQRMEKDKERGAMNARFPIMKEHNGIIVMRNSRQIDVISSTCPWTTFVNYDRNWGVEIDFPPALDEDFSITTSKQQVRLSERMWEILDKAGVKTAIEEMRRRFKRETAELKAKLETEREKQRASELAMTEAAQFKTRKPGGDPEERLAQSEEALNQEIQRRAEKAGLAPEKIELEVRAEIQREPYKVSVENTPGAPFFRMVQLGGQKTLYLNSGHRFYTDVYAGPDSTPRLRAALEVVLFVIGESELDSTDDRRLFYQVERGEWSTRLSVALTKLENVYSVDDELASEEVAEQTSER